MNRYYPKIFEKGKLGRREAKNRLVLCPMGENFANPDGSLSEQYIAYYAERAKGGVGTIVTGVVSVDYPQGKTIDCQSRLDSLKYVKDFNRLAREVHRYGTLLIVQLHHAGASTDAETCDGVTPYRVSDPDPDGLKMQLPGPKMDENYDPTAHEFKTLTLEEIKMLEQKFIQSAIYAQMAGCDGVELHGITYLVCHFLTKGINFRTDEYGGSLENRMRFPLNIIRGIREACGPNFIIGLRMALHKWETDGFTDEENIIMAKAFEEAGCDYLDAAGGISPTITCLIESQRFEQGDRVHLAAQIKEAVNIPVMAVGKLREPDFIENVLEDGKADFIKFGRTLLADPEWPNKARTGRAKEIRRCISCMAACNGNLQKHHSIQCILNPVLGSENWLRSEPPAKKKKRVVVVGGGIAGMQAAITATERGHDVVILEETDRLGGQLHIAAVPPHKQDIAWATDWFIGEVQRKYIRVEYNCKATAEIIKSYHPDAVILATGSRPWMPPVPGIEKGIESWDILAGKVELPKNKKVTIIGGGEVGCETGLLLHPLGNQITILEMQSNYANEMDQPNKIDLAHEFKEKGISVITSAKVTSVDEETVSYETPDGPQSLSSEYVIIAAGQKSYGTELIDELEAEGLEVAAVGDAMRPANILNATQTGFMAALNL